MKTQRMTSATMFLGIFLILSGIIAGEAVYMKVLEMNSHFGMEKIIVTQKNAAMNNSHPITVSDIERIKKTMEVTDISYSSSIKTYVQGNNRNEEVEITGTNSVYPQFSSIRLATGSFFTEEAEKESSRVAIIDAKLAIKLFNSLEVIENKISIFGQSFSIIGVVSTDSSIVQSLIEDGMPTIFIPDSTFFELNNTAAITHVEIKSPNNDTLGNNSKLVSKALEAIGKNPGNYNIIDFNIKEALIKQKPDILIFLVGCISILILILYIKREFASMLGLIVREAKSDYISSIIRANFFEIILLVVKIAAVAVCAIIIWKLIKFGVYIPPEYIPTDLTDVGYFKDLIHNNITTGNSDLGYLASKPEQMLYAAQNIINISFIVSLLPGFILFYTGMYQARALEIDSFKLLIQAGISLLLSTLVLMGLIVYFDMSFYGNISSYVVLWIFICTNVIRFGNIPKRGDVSFKKGY